jgi:hypothetical protein
VSGDPGVGFPYPLRLYIGAFRPSKYCSLERLYPVTSSGCSVLVFGNTRKRPLIGTPRRIKTGTLTWPISWRQRELCESDWVLNSLSSSPPNLRNLQGLRGKTKRQMPKPRFSIKVVQLAFCLGSLIRLFNRPKHTTKATARLQN